MGKKMIIGIGDCHFPFVEKTVLNWIMKIIQAKKSELYAVVQMGDLYDLFSYSKFPKRLILTPKEETYQGRIMAEKMWERIHRIAPRAKKFQLKGNHDERLRKRIEEKMPEIDHLIDWDGLFCFDHVETIDDSRDDLDIFGWHFIHGHANSGQHIQAVGHSDVCCAHTHRGGTWSLRLHENTRKNDPKIFTELNCGFVANPFHEALIYRPMRKFFQWTWGVGMIDQYGGRFIPFEGKIK